MGVSIQLKQTLSRRSIDQLNPVAERVIDEAALQPVDRDVVPGKVTAGVEPGTEGGEA